MTLVHKLNNTEMLLPKTVIKIACNKMQLKLGLA